MAGPRPHFAVFRSVLFALWYRDLRSRYADARLGWTWALAGPCVGVALFSVIAGVRGREDLRYGVEYPVFLLTGMVPFSLWLSATTAGTTAIGQGSGLFIFRQVKPFDVLLAKSMHAVALHGTALGILVAAAGWLGFQVVPYDPLGVLMALGLLAALGWGGCLILAVLALRMSETRRVVPIALRPMFFISGVIFPTAAIPEAYHPWLLWNPVLHGLELLRAAWLPGFVPVAGAQWSVLAGSALVAVGVGMMAYRQHRAALAGDAG